MFAASLVVNGFYSVCRFVLGLCPSKDMISCGQLAQPACPRRRLFVAVRSAARTVQIGRAAVVLRKTPFSFRKSTRAPDVLSEFFTKNASCYFQIDAQSRTDAHWFVCKKDLHFIEIQPALHRHSHHFLRKHHLIFLKSKNSPPFIISFLFSKKICGARAPRAWARLKD